MKTPTMKAHMIDCNISPCRLSPAQQLAAWCEARPRLTGIGEDGMPYSLPPKPVVPPTMSEPITLTLEAVAPRSIRTVVMTAFAKAAAALASRLNALSRKLNKMARN